MINNFKILKSIINSLLGILIKNRKAIFKTFIKDKLKMSKKNKKFYQKNEKSKRGLNYRIVLFNQKLMNMIKKLILIFMREIKNL